MITPAPFLALCALLAASAPAQDVLFELPRPSAGDPFRKLVRLADIDGDQVDDWACSGDRGLALYSGRLGTLLRQFPATDASHELGWAVCGPGDVDGDGTGDIWIATPNGGPGSAGIVELWSGATGKLLRTLHGAAGGDRFGHALASLPDIDQDGAPELCVAAPGHDNIGPDAGLVQVFSGRSGRPLAYFTGPAAGARFGETLVRVGDLDADGQPELAAGIPLLDSIEFLSPAKARRLHGAAGATGSGFGAALHPAGDLDQDGLPDLWVLAPDQRGTSGGLGLLHLVSGKDGALLRALEAPLPWAELRSLTPGLGAGQYGVALAAAGDIDQDGIDDLWVGDPLAAGGAGQVELRSGKDGSLIRSLLGKTKGDLFGTALLGGLQLDADGLPDLVVGIPGADRVELRSGKDGGLIRGLDGNSGELYGRTLALLGDRDRDGWPDLAIGAEASDQFRGRVELRSTRAGASLGILGGIARGESFGAALCTVPDLDQDGLDELVVASPWADAAAGRVRLFASRTGKIVLEAKGPAAGALFGAALEPAGDLDADGVPELWIGVPGTGAATGAVQALSLDDGHPVLVLSGWRGGDRFGAQMARLRDLDGDGLDELVVAGPGDPWASQAQDGGLDLFSGARLLLHRDGARQSALGLALGVAGDFDGDGAADLAVASRGTGTGAVHLWQVLDLCRDFGRVLAPLGDLDGDHLDDLALGLGARNRVELRSGKDDRVLTVLEAPDSTPGFGRALAAVDLDAHGSLELAIGARDRLWAMSTLPLLLRPDTTRIVATKGGLQKLTLSAGKSGAGKLYIVLGSATGIRPTLALGAHSLALVPDDYFTLSLGGSVQAPILASPGYLDLAGKASSGVRIPVLPKAFEGLALHHAFVVLGFGYQVELCSNPVPLLLTGP